jgi:hypothetical protein
LVASSSIIIELIATKAEFIIMDIMKPSESKAVAITTSVFKANHLEKAISLVSNENAYRHAYAS